MKANKIKKNDHIKEEILEKAKELFRCYGFNKTTMEDIAETMSKGKSTLYYYFSGKDEVFVAVAQSEIFNTFKTILEEVNKHTSAEKRFRAFFLKRFEVLKKMMTTYRVMLREKKKNTEVFNEMQLKFNSLEKQIIKDILLYGVKSGEFKSISKKDCDSLAFATSAILQGINSYIFEEGYLPPIVDHLDLLFNTMIRGIS